MTKTKSYGSTPIKRARRSKQDIEALKAALYSIVEADRPMTVRQVFYQATSRGLVPKTEAAYKGIVVRLLGDMRLEGSMPFEWLADSTRWMRKPISYGSMQDALSQMQNYYRRAIWDSQQVQCEIWLEKDALAGVLLEVTQQWDVPLMITRGYASHSFLHTSARAIASRKKPAHLFYFGDYDASGVNITLTVERRLREFAPEADIHFHRVAVTPGQIRRYELPTRPSKKTDSRAKSFGDESVEVDALPSGVLRDIASSCITNLIDFDQLEKLHAVERVEKASLKSLCVNL